MRVQSLGWRSPGEGNDNPLQYSCLKKIPWAGEPGGLQTTGHGVTDSRKGLNTALSDGLQILFEVRYSALQGQRAVPQSDCENPASHVAPSVLTARTLRESSCLQFLLILLAFVTWLPFTCPCLFDSVISVSCITQTLQKFGGRGGVEYKSQPKKVELQGCWELVYFCLYEVEKQNLKYNNVSHWSLLQGLFIHLTWPAPGIPLDSHDHLHLRDDCPISHKK